MRILIVDDNIEKISELSSLIYSIKPKAFIETAENVVNAVELFSKNPYNLAVIDLLLPIKKNDLPKKEGGKFLLDELNRKDTLIKPNYILGFTQHNEEIEFSNIWKIIQYNSSSLWKNSFLEMIRHIDKSKIFEDKIEIIKPTIFTEGLTDKYYLEESFKLFSNIDINEFSVKSQKNAGANWVANQVPIWAMGLKTNSNNEYIKAIGLLDSDEAGNIAKQKIDNRNLSDNEKKCCHIFQLSASYNPDVTEFFKNKCKIEIEIETLFDNDILLYADKQGWLEFRTNTFIQAPNDWKQHEETTLQYIQRKNIPEKFHVYLKKVKFDCKEKFSQYIKSLPNKNEVFKNFKPLVEDIEKKIF